MPRTEATRTINVPAEDAFALSMSQLEVRYAWDPFVSEQRLLNGATRPDRGVHSLTKSKHGLTMVSEYTSFKPPTQVGMKLVSGPPFFATGSDIETRLKHFAEGCPDPELIARAHAQLRGTDG